MFMTETALAQELQRRFYAKQRELGLIRHLAAESIAIEHEAWLSLARYVLSQE